jgi:hypothetical protein
VVSKVLKTIRGTMEFADGETVEFQLADEVDSRWGNTESVLWRAVGPCEVMVDALRDEGYFREEDDEEESE